MKSNFSREQVYVPEFDKNKELPDDQQLKVKVGVMKMLDLLDLTDVLKSAGFEKGDVKDLSVDQMKTIVREAGKYVPKYCTLVNAEDFSVDDTISYSQFLPLASELLFTLLNSSSPNAVDVKN